MQRGNYRNIGNSFISAGVYAQQQQQQQSPMAQRNTRSNPAVSTPVQPSSSVGTNNIEIKTEQPVVVAPPVALTSAPMDLVSNMKDNQDLSESESDLLKLKKINFKKKVSGKEKRSKQNKKLYRMLTPRNAIAALNELTLGQNVGETVVLPIAGSKFEAEVVLHNVKYKGQGPSKMSAKNNACEKALRDLIINKFKQAKQQDAVSVASDDINMDECDSASDVPMLQLASFALHKLFSEWESEGFEVPFPKTPENPQAAPSSSSSAMATESPPKVPSTPKPPKVKNELPPNNTTMHPVMLLSIMRPCTQYNDLGSQGITPTIMHTVGATVDGQSFIGQGRSKKEARKRVATTVLQKFFDWQGSCC